MSASVTWKNLDQFRATLVQIPDDLSAQAKGWIRGAAQASLLQIRSAYPVDSGALVRGVSAREASKGRWQEASRVISRAPHASIFEQGTKTRRALTRNGHALKKPANRGFMPAAKIFVPVVVQERARLMPRLKAIVEKAGFEVHGE